MIEYTAAIVAGDDVVAAVADEAAVVDVVDVGVVVAPC